MRLKRSLVGTAVVAAAMLVGGTLSADTLGFTGPGTTIDSGDAGKMTGSQFQSTTGGAVAEMTVYIGPVDTSDKFSTAIYKADGPTGLPGTLVAKSDCTTAPVPAGCGVLHTGLNTIRMEAGAAIAPNSTYWLMYNASGKRPNIDNMTYTAGGRSAFQTRSFSAGWPSQFGQATESSPGVTFAIAATYTPPTTDSTPPTVLSVDPPNNASGVSVNATINFGFSEALDSGTLTDAWVRLNVGTTVLPSSASLSSDGKTLILTPNAPLSLNTAYTATATQAVADPAGNYLTSEYQISFDTIVSSTVVVLGNDHIGSTNDTQDSGYMTGSKFTTGATPMTVNSMSAYVRGIAAAPYNQYQFAIYADSGTGLPGAWKYTSSLATFPASAGDGWYSATFGGVTLAANTTYWLVYNTNGNTKYVNNLVYDTAAAGSGVNSATTAFGSWPTTWNAPRSKSGLTSAKYSIFASS